MENSMLWNYVLYQPHYYLDGYADSTSEVAMDIGSERLSQNIPKTDMFDFISTPSENLKPLGLESENNNTPVVKTEFNFDARSFDDKKENIYNNIVTEISSQGSPLVELVTKPAKKYTKRSKSTTPTVSSSGVRKERPLQYCNICCKGFKDKYSVNVHIRTHTGEKPFTCSLCGKSFRQKGHLVKHYQTHMAKTKNGLSTSKSAENLIPSS